MNIVYYIRRIFLFIIVIITAISLNFFLPRWTGQDPVQQKIVQLEIESGGGGGENSELIESYRKKFGLDKSLADQYLTYVISTLKLDFGYSISLYPSKVSDLIGRALPWTLGLLTVSTLISFLVGSLVGAYLTWSRGRKILESIIPILFVFSAIPFYLLGLVLIWLFAFELSWFPLFGGYRPTTIPDNSLKFFLEVLEHSILPAFSIILAQSGFWALGMRSMMVTTKGEDYMTLAEAKGLHSKRIFFNYGVRNAILPQVTALALSLSHIISGAILVEIVFSYPGIGSLLYQGIKAFDYFIIQGVVFILVISIAFSMLLIDLIYPLIDPRVKISNL